MGVAPVPRARATVSRTLRGASRRRTVVAAVGAIAAVALIIGVILAAGFSGSSQGAAGASTPSGSTTVQRRDLVQTDTESGTLGYSDPQTVFNRLSGTITALPAVGQVISAGQTLYRVDGAPVTLFSGTVPAYRTMSEGIADGPDVQELKQNLVKLGYDPSHQITVNQTFDAATTAAVERWQAALGQTQTGTVTLGQVVFLGAPRRITAVDTVLGSTGGSGSAGGSAASSASGTTGASVTPTSTTSLASTTPAPARPEFVSLTTTSTTTTSTTSTSTSSTSTRGGKPSGKPGAGPASTIAALIALLRAETAELQKSRSGSGTTPAASGRGAGSTASTKSPTAGRSGSGGSGGSAGARGSGSAGAGTGSATSASSGGSSTASGAAAGASAILGTTSTQLVVNVALDATKQSEAVVGESVSVQLPDGSTADGKITQVSPVAQTASSSSSSSSGAAGGGGSSSPSATIPVTITLNNDRHIAGLDQAAVSVNFQQQKATGVLSVPVSALLATAGGGYAVQEAAVPHRLIPVTPGLFAAGYVQISGAGIYPGLAVTDSQG